MVERTRAGDEAASLVSARPHSLLGPCCPPGSTAVVYSPSAPPHTVRAPRPRAARPSSSPTSSPLVTTRQPSRRALAPTATVDQQAHTDRLRALLGYAPRPAGAMVRACSPRLASQLSLAPRADLLSLPPSLPPTPWPPRLAYRLAVVKATRDHPARLGKAPRRRPRLERVRPRSRNLFPPFALSSTSTSTRTAHVHLMIPFSKWESLLRFASNPR